MNTYKIRYKQGEHGIQYAKADTLKDFLLTKNTYVFKIGDEIAATISKENIVSIERVKDDDEN